MPRSNAAKVVHPADQLAPLKAAILNAFTTETLSAEMNVTDALLSIASQLKWLGTGDASTTMGAIEARAVLIKEAAEDVASALRGIGDAISDLASAVRESQS